MPKRCGLTRHRSNGHGNDHSITE